MHSYPTYRSPIRLLDELGVDFNNLSPERLKQERKRLLLEIQFSEEQILEVHGRKFTKNDVLIFFDEFETFTQDQIAFHSAIYTSKELVDFLENGKVERRLKSLEKVTDKIGGKNDKFTEFLSPYLSPIFEKLVLESIKKGNFLELDRVDDLFDFLTPDDAKRAFKPFEVFCLSLKEYLIELVRKFEEVAGTKIYPKKETGFLHYRPFFNFTNHVEIYFPGISDEVVRAVLTFVDETKGSLGELDGQHKMLSQAKILRCSEELEKAINEKIKRFPSRHDLDSGPGLSLKSVFQIIGLIILILMFFSRSCDSGQSKANEEFLEKLERMQTERNTSESQRKRRVIGSNFDEMAFNELHHQVFNIVQDSAFTQEVTYQGSQPIVRSRFMKPKPSTTIEVKNQTSSDLLIVVLTGSSLNSSFIKHNSSGTFNGNETSQIFFYSGNDWQSDKTIRTLIGALAMIDFSGRFTKVSEKDLDFLRKRYNLMTADAMSFTVVDHGFEYELYCGNKEMRHSF